MNEPRVAVAVRIRPILRSGGSLMHQQERFELVAAKRTGDTSLTLHDEKPDDTCRTSVFTFDHIFEQESTQLEVYEEAVQGLVDVALLGQSATVLAYGQTGSGKTHTVLGDAKPNPLEDDLLTPNSGLFLRVLGDLLIYRRRVAKRLHVVILLSCVEIYNEQIRDLFGGKATEAPPPVKVIMTDELVYMPQVTVKEATSLQAVFSEIQLAISRRQSRSTEANQTSSRSHCLFMIEILQRSVASPAPTIEQYLTFSKMETSSNGGGLPRTSPTTTAGLASGSRHATVTPGTPSVPQGRSGAVTPTVAPNNEAIAGFLGSVWQVPGEEPILASKLVIADLAGSEKTSKSGVTGDGLAEATSINSSLTALGNVVHSLYEGTFVSYRVSNLTRLLKPSFSHPNSRVLLLAQVSPTQLTFDESLSTLHFANKVKQMKVVTTQGVDVERLTKTYLETERVAESLFADLRVFAKEHDVGPWFPRRGDKLGGPSHPVYRVMTVPARKKQLEAKDRRPFLQEPGKFPID